MEIKSSHSILFKIFLLFTITCNISLNIFATTKNKKEYYKFIKASIIEKIHQTDTLLEEKDFNSKIKAGMQHLKSSIEDYEVGKISNSITEYKRAIIIFYKFKYYNNVDKYKEYTDFKEKLFTFYEKISDEFDFYAPDLSFTLLREKVNYDISLIEKTFTNKSYISEIVTEDSIILINREVEAYIKYYSKQKSGIKFINNCMSKIDNYFDMMSGIFKEEGLPVKLIYLSVIESGLNPEAISPTGAVGLWQFIRSTAKSYGLQINSETDDRKDPEKSTRAAAQYLKFLFKLFNDWHLSIAAYNCGEGLIKKKITTNKNTFWDIQDTLPSETRKYVPNYIALTKIFLNPEQYGFR